MYSSIYHSTDSFTVFTVVETVPFVYHRTSSVPSEGRVKGRETDTTSTTLTVLLTLGREEQRWERRVFSLVVGWARVCGQWDRGDGGVLL